MLEEGLAQLEDAEREGDGKRIGDAHLVIVDTLAKNIDDIASAEEKQKRYRQMLEHTDMALRHYESLETPWRMTNTLLMKASILAEMAWDEESEETRFEDVRQALEHCEQALTVLNEAEALHFELSGIAYANAVTILLRIRPLLKVEEAQQALNELIKGCSGLMGECFAWDIQHRAEGNDLLFMARVLGTLVEVEKDPQERLETVRAELETALEAVDRLRHTSDLDLVREAYALVQETRDQMRTLEKARVDQAKSLQCPTCGAFNPPGSRFCNQCGTPL